MKTIREIDIYSGPVNLAYYIRVFNGKIPSIFQDTKAEDVLIVVSDPKIVHELYVTKNKFTDKDPIFTDMFWDLL